MSSSWNVQANGKKARAGNRSDAIIIPSPVINYVRPNLFWEYGKYAGPADIWNQNKGFLVQSTNPESYNLNFPTTGAHNLHFDLLISGVDINELTWEPVTLGGITATVANVEHHEPWAPWNNGKAVARVMLTGPDSGNQWNNPNPNRIAKPQLPQTFELVGRDINTGDEVVKYGFVLRQWFVGRGGPPGFSLSNQTTWCNSLGYRMPRVRDLTNAVCSGRGSGSWCQGAVGATPSSSGNHYQRHIGAGFFTEWGNLGFYHTFIDHVYWTSDASGSNQLRVAMSTGAVLTRDDDDNFFRRGICTVP
ncbi:hypothetical protein [Gilliamella sp. BG1]|uniref:hypothetical protein n=1 Tax=Gilliamella sp. BG1 TaxID=3351508 RepID=UPI003986607F